MRRRLRCLKVDLLHTPRQTRYQMYEVIRVFMSSLLFVFFRFAMGRLKMRDWNYRHQTAGGGKCGTKELWNAKAPCCSGSQKIICPIICWKYHYQCCNCVFQYYDSVSDRLDPYGYEKCVNLISFYVQCYGLQSVKRNTRNTQTYMAHIMQ